MVQNKRIILILSILLFIGIVHAVSQSTETTMTWPDEPTQFNSNILLKMKQGLTERIAEMDLATEQSKTRPSDFIKKYGERSVE